VSGDCALWITWYDLADGVRERYLSWLHEQYIPGQLARPGFLWAAHYASDAEPVRTAKKSPRRYPPAGSVPGGHGFLLIFGADRPHAFANPSPRQLHARLEGVDRDMIALRQGETTNVMVEEARIDGPEAARREAGMALSPCIQLGSFVHDDEDELMAWYAQWRLPSMRSLPGCIGVRKLVSVAGWAKHAILHEFTSVEARNAEFVNHERNRHPEMAEWSERVTGQVVHYPGSPNVARRIFSAVAR